MRKISNEVLEFPIDLDPLLPAIKDIIRNDIEQHFGASIDWHGIPFEPLQKPDHQPLIVSGALRASAIAAVESAHFEGNRLVVEADDLVDYAGYQFDGTRTIPARDAWGVSYEALYAISSLCQEYIAEQLGGS